ncbi:MAG: hypothetical protein RR522_02475 [Alistipes sp.]
MTAYLLRQTTGLNRAMMLERLFDLGVISHHLCEQHALRTEVEQRTRSGCGRCEAMEAVAIDFNCSYAKVRQAVYYKPKN